MSPALPPLVAPVRGERYASSDLKALIAPPYDVISPGERERLALQNAHNIVHLILPEGNDDRYARAARTLQAWRAGGALLREAEPSVYAVTQTFTTPDGRACTRTGLLAGVHVEPYQSGRVRPHERTHAGPKADRLALLRAARTSFESLFLLARDAAGELHRYLGDVTRSAPLALAELLAVRVGIWRVSGSAASRLCQAAGDALYIADGHHRYETSVAYRQENASADRVVALIVPLGDPGLVVLATHRLIHGNPISEQAAVAALGKDLDFTVLEPELNPVAALTASRGRGVLGMVVLPTGRVLSLRLRTDGNAPAATISGSLDVARIDQLVVSRLRELAGDGSRVSYSADPVEVFTEVGRERAAAGVLLRPTRVEDVLAVADAGEFMPQKSTYFVPKVPSGLLLLPY